MRRPSEHLGGSLEIPLVMFCAYFEDSSLLFRRSTGARLQRHPMHRLIILPQYLSSRSGGHGCLILLISLGLQRVQIWDWFSVYPVPLLENEDQPPARP